LDSHIVYPVTASTNAALSRIIVALKITLVFRRQNDGH
jgi:hypothetical protein